MMNHMMNSLMNNELMEFVDAKGDEMKPALEESTSPSIAGAKKESGHLFRAIIFGNTVIHMEQ